MKRLIMCCLIAFFSASAKESFCATESATLQQNIQLFYDQLRPYGTWLDHPTYGAIWLPSECPDKFFPYGSDGFWISTELGWTWISIYEWGWAPFHYGRWGYEEPHGWFWVPDTVWAPAWVHWRHMPGYFGWAPMPPGSTIESSGSIPQEWWIFCDHVHFGYRTIGNSFASAEIRGKIYPRTKPITATITDPLRKTQYLAGPDKALVEQQTGRKVEILRVADLATPGKMIANGEAKLFRPQIQGSLAERVTRQIKEHAPVCIASTRPSMPVELIAPASSFTQHPTGKHP